MDECVKTLLKDGGIDIQSLLERCMGSEALLIRLLKKFPTDISYTKLSTAIQIGDVVAALEASHTLKGVCGNLSLTTLFTLLDKQVQALRENDMTRARTLMPDISQAYAAALHAIEKSLS